MSTASQRAHISVVHPEDELVVENECALHVEARTNGSAECRVVVPPTCAVGLIIWPSSTWRLDDADVA